MIKSAKKRKDNTGAAIRRRLTAAISMLLISTIMMVTTTYAWFTLSTAPEVRGINTSVTGNGSLEIALMPTTGTFAGITSGRDASGTEDGGSKGMTEANVTWGNVVNLKDQSYGLDLITLNPVKFDVKSTAVNRLVYDENNEPVMEPTGETDPETQEPVMAQKTTAVNMPNGQIGDVPFSRPVYGYDGRIVDLKAAQLKSHGTSAGFDSDNYGVRAIVDENGTTYGYVIDLALRLNAVKSVTLTEGEGEEPDTVTTTPGKLLLQTEGVQRVYSDSTANATQGGGSNLWFQDEEGNDISGTAQTQASKYLEAIRIAFVQNFGNANALSSATVLALARADKNNGDLYLCDSDGNALSGEDAATIYGNMSKNQAYQISVVVWLDGEAVTNAEMAINNDELSKATLNLQFATDVALVPAQNSNLKNNPPEPVTEAVTEAETDAETVTETEAEQPEPHEP